MKIKSVIGLEVHVQLASKTKIFCGCKNEFGAEANSQTCPVCLGLPGSLPVFNESVFDLSLKAAIALNCKVSSEMKFDRKHYFYPDLPKDYQISQYDMPLATKGYLDIEDSSGTKRIGITRVHLEEDAGKLIHQQNKSLVDFNRCGTPLIEIVSEPDINTPDEAYSYLTSLKSILTYLEVSDCNMQEGSLRCDANVSVQTEEANELGVKVEIKNLNSFKAVKNALDYEIKRQSKLLETGEKIIQETRLWDEAAKKTTSMRTKEEAHDYRYFPEPDLPMFEATDERLKRVKAAIPELPEARRNRFIKEYKLSAYDARVITASKSMADYFESALEADKNIDVKAVVNWLSGALLSVLNARGEDFSSIKLRPADFATMVRLVAEGKVNANSAKEQILPEIIGGGKKPDQILKEKGLQQLSDEGKLAEIVEQVIADNDKSANDYKAGKKNAIMYLMGQVMRATKGKANPQIIQEMIKTRLEEE